MLSLFDRYERSEYLIFLSYSKEYSGIVTPMAEWFRLANLHNYSFQSTPNPYGTKLQEEIFKNIDKSRFFILFWGEASVNSKWVKRELNYAIENNKIIIPIVLDEYSVEELPSYAKEYMYINAFDDIYDEDEEYFYIEELVLYKYAHKIIVDIKDSFITEMNQEIKNLEKKLKELESNQKPKVIQQNKILKFLNPFNR